MKHVNRSIFMIITLAVMLSLHCNISAMLPVNKYDEVLYNVLQAQHINNDIGLMIAEKKHDFCALPQNKDALSSIMINDLKNATQQALSDVIVKKSSLMGNIHDEINEMYEQLTCWGKSTGIAIEEVTAWIAQKRAWNKHRAELVQEISEKIVFEQELTCSAVAQTIAHMHKKAQALCDDASQLLSNIQGMPESNPQLSNNVSDLLLPQGVFDELSLEDLESLQAEELAEMINRLEACDRHLASQQKACIQRMLSSLSSGVRIDEEFNESLMQRVYRIEQALDEHVELECEKIMRNYDEGCAQLRHVMEKKVDELRSYVFAQVNDLVHEIECYETETCKCATEYFVTCAERIRDSCAEIYKRMHDQMNESIAQTDAIDCQTNALSCNILFPMVSVLSDFKTQQNSLKNNILNALENLKNNISATVISPLEDAKQALSGIERNQQELLQKKHNEYKSHLYTRLDDTLYALAAYQQNADKVLGSLQAHLNSYLHEQVAGLLQANARINKDMSDAIIYMYDQLEANFNQMLAVQLCMKRTQYGALCEKLSCMQAQVIKRINTLSVEFDRLVADLIDQSILSSRNVRLFTQMALMGLIEVVGVAIKYTVNIVNVTSALTELGLLISYDPVFYILFCFV